MSSKHLAPDESIPCSCTNAASIDDPSALIPFFEQIYREGGLEESLGPEEQLTTLSPSVILPPEGKTIELRLLANACELTITKTVTNEIIIFFIEISS